MENLLIKSAHDASEREREIEIVFSNNDLPFPYFCGFGRSQDVPFRQLNIDLMVGMER